MSLIPWTRWLVVQQRLPQTDICTLVDNERAAVIHMRAVRRKDPKAVLYAMEVLTLSEED